MNATTMPARFEPKIHVTQFGDLLCSFGILFDKLLAFKTQTRTFQARITTSRYHIRAFSASIESTLGPDTVGSSWLRQSILIATTMQSSPCCTCIALQFFSTTALNGRPGSDQIELSCAPHNCTVMITKPRRVAIVTSHTCSHNTRRTKKHSHTNESNNNNTTNNDTRTCPETHVAGWEHGMLSALTSLSLELKLGRARS